MIQKARLKSTTEVECMEFKTNNEVGSPNMDAIVNWVNDGLNEKIAWHNGTDIFIDTISGNHTARVGNFIMKSPDNVGDFWVYSQKEFQSKFEII